MAYSEDEYTPLHTTEGSCDRGVQTLQEPTNSAALKISPRATIPPLPFRFQVRLDGARGPLLLGEIGHFLGKRF